MLRRAFNVFILLLVIGVLMISFPYIYGILTNSMRVNTTGVVADLNLGIYRDYACTEKLTSINWGAFAPGTYKTQTFYIKNLGTINTTLAFQTQDWNPAQATSYLSFITCAPYENPVGYWQFNERSGNRAFDSSGFNHTGIITNCTWAPSLFSSALNFSEKSVVTVPSEAIFNISRHVTLAAWIYPTRLDAFTRIVAKSHVVNQHPYTMYGLLLDNNGHLRIEVAINGTQQSLNGQTLLDIGQWTHVAGTFDGQEFRLYVNGVLDASRRIYGTIDYNNMPVTIGASGFNDDYFHGGIDEVRIYSRALSSNEIESLANISQPPFVDPANTCTQVISPNQIIEVTVTLLVSDYVTQLDTFQFNIVIESMPWS